MANNLMIAMHAGDPRLVAALEMQFHVIWPRFITAMAILAVMIGAAVYLEMRSSKPKNK